MKYAKLEYFLSQPRLNRFFIASGHSKAKAQGLYKANLRIAQSFYPILNLFEIFLRNSIHYQLSSYFTNPNWIITEKNRFMNDSSLRPSRFYLRNSIDRAERKIRQSGAPITPGKIIAEQSLGFWTSLFETHHYRLIGGSVIHAFPNKPPNINRSILSQKLNRIRTFRNRVYHNEPLCFNGNTIDFTEARNIKFEIFELLEWMDRDLVSYVQYFDNIENKIIQAENL